MYDIETIILSVAYYYILQPLQICQVGEYPCVKIHNVVGTKIPVKQIKKKLKFKILLQTPIFLWLFLEMVDKIGVSGV